MIGKRRFFFWLLVWVLLTFLFSPSLHSWTISFYFVTLLMPVVMATSAFFNRLLVPKYLLSGKKFLFGLYLIYMLIVSIYLELLVVIWAFVILADYQIENLGKIAGDIYLLTIILYLIVFIDSLILTIQKLREQSEKLSLVENKLKKEQLEEIEIRENRKSVLLVLDDILFIESMGDYVRIHTKTSTHTTKEKISSFQQRLPPSFIRIHRSFIVNKVHISSFTKEEVIIEEIRLTVGRKYKQQFAIALKETIIA